MLDLKLIAATDPEVAAAMELELSRQRDHIELIASENIVSPAVMAAMGSHLTNKYAEGYPGKRYYGGCQYVDIVENLARDRLNVEPDVLEILPGVMPEILRRICRSVPTPGVAGGLLSQ